MYKRTCHTVTVNRNSFISSIKNQNKWSAECVDYEYKFKCLFNTKYFIGDLWENNEKQLPIQEIVRQVIRYFWNCYFGAGLTLNGQA